MTNTGNALPVAETIRAAWVKTNGAKSSIWAAKFISALIYFILFGIGKHLPPNMVSARATIPVAVYFILSMSKSGIQYIGIQRAANMAITYKQMYRAFSGSVALNLILLIILRTFILLAPLRIALDIGYIEASIGISTITFSSMILLLTAIFISAYLSLGIILSPGYVIANDMGAFEAIARSFKTTKGHLFELFIVFIISNIILLLLALPFGIGLIWGLPFAYVLYGEIFQRLSTPASPDVTH